jgi:type I restriction enzyme S subunit
LIDDQSFYDRYIVSNKQMKLTPNRGVADPLFFYYAFSEASFVEHLQGISIGSSVPGFNLGQLRKLILRIP